jgi:adenylosuccinate lyase
MTDSRLHALSPLDGRYAEKCADLAALFSEAALNDRRIRVEAAWFRQLAEGGRFPALPRPAAPVATRIEALSRGLDASGHARVKALEQKTNHDVKAVEYYVREALAAAGATPSQL